MSIHQPRFKAGINHDSATQTPRLDAADNNARPLFAFEQLDVQFDTELDTLWTYMCPRVRPSFNPDLLREFGQWQDDIVRACTSGTAPIRYLVLGSRFPGVFSLGGDLDLFSQHIRAHDRDALARYGRACVRILHRNMLGLDLPIVTPDVLGLRGDPPMVLVRTEVQDPRSDTPYRTEFAVPVIDAMEGGAS